MNWLAWIIVGGVSGWIASIITRNNKRMGCLTNIVVGVIGGILGGFLMDLAGRSGVTGLNLWSVFVSVIGAVVLLVIINLVRAK